MMQWRASLTLALTRTYDETLQNQMLVFVQQAFTSMQRVFFAHKNRLGVTFCDNACHTVYVLSGEYIENQMKDWAGENNYLAVQLPLVCEI